jgi:hypothetical protein
VTDTPSPRPTSPASLPPTNLPPDPEAYDDPRSVRARARGLPGPYIHGGRDPNPEEGRREDRFWSRVLVAMVIVIVLGGFAIGIAISIALSASGQ